jgi:LCP family protein required for cell wall assembly
MTQAQPVPPRRSSLGRAERGSPRPSQSRPVSVLGTLRQQADVPERAHRQEQRSRGRFGNIPWLPFGLGIACGWVLAGPLPHLMGTTVSGVVRAPQERLAAIVNPFATGQRRVLVMGTDRVGENTDVMFTVEVKDGATQVTQVPRDTFVDSPELGVLKANALYAFGGVDTVKDEVGKLLNSPVERYLRVNLRAVERLADALGGVEVDVPKRMYYVDNAQGLYIDLYPGPQLLKGEALEGFLRYRHDEMGDLGRMERQKLVLAQVFRKLIQPSMVGELPGLLKIAGDDVQTDLSPIEMGQLLTAMANTTLSSSQVPGRLYWYNDLSYWMPESNPHYASVGSGETGSGETELSSMP